MLAFPYRFEDPNGPLELLALAQLGFWSVYCWWVLRQPPPKEDE